MDNVMINGTEEKILKFFYFILYIFFQSDAPRNVLCVAVQMDLYLLLVVLYV